MTCTPRSLALLVLSILAFPPSARAGDYWVDAQNGANSNSGLGADQAWQSVSFALTALPAAGVDTLHLLPGAYDTALGESFPLVLRDGLTLQGEGAPGEVRILPPANGLGLSASSVSASVRGISLEFPSASTSGVAIRLQHSVVLSSAGLVLDDIHVVGAQKAIVVHNDNPFSSPTSLFVSSSNFESCGVGVTLDNGSDGSGIDAKLLTSNFKDGSGLLVQNAFGANVDVLVERCTLLGAEGDAIALLNLNTQNIELRISSSLVASSLGRGLRFSRARVLMQACTVAENLLAGVEQTGTSSAQSSFTDSILHGNGDDLDLIDFALLTNCNVGDGDQLGLRGNISVDPLFVAPSQGDFRLGFASACVDALPASLTPLDLNGRPRDVDGDLDLLPGRDLGPYELQTLQAPEVLALGQFWTAEVHGQPGSSARLVLARGGLLASPVSTPFGSLWLPLAGALVVGPLDIPGSAPTQVQLPLPNDPAFIGLQALVASSSAPAGVAWTQALESIVLP